MSPQELLCQSCSMPMQQDADFGTNTDGGKNEEYCTYCFQKGQFTRPDFTLSQTIELLVSMASKMDMTEDDARKLAMEVLPQLKRWKQTA